MVVVPSSMFFMFVVQFAFDEICMYVHQQRGASTLPLALFLFAAI